MRQLLIDELNRTDAARLDDYLRGHARTSSMNGLYWVELDRELLRPEQAACEADHPFCFAVEIGDSWAKFELLIRSLPNMRSLHTGYADPAQQRFILDYANRLIEELGLTT